MKNKPLVLLILIIGFTSCKKDEPISEIPKGTLKLNVGVFISVNEIENQLKSTHAADDFLVTIYNSLGIEVLVFQRAAEMPDEIELEPGQYFVTADSDNDLPAAFNNPYYYGESSLFTITPGEQETVSLNCELANTMVTIVYSDHLKANYINYETTVSTSAGSLVFTMNENRPGFFRPLPMSISVRLTRQREDGTSETKTLTGAITDPQPKRNYEIHIDASSAAGAAFIQINLDSLIDLVEIIQIDESVTVPGPIREGDLLITEIMADPGALEDMQGEWFEIYNSTDEPIDLYHLVIRKNTTDQHIITGNVSVPVHGYIVMARTTNAVTAPGYVYGSSISLNNSGATLSISNYGTDGSNGSLIYSINYASAGFPVIAAGGSICLSPLLLNYAAAVSGNSWCVSESPYSTGDLGTPGSQNDACE